MRPSARASWQTHDADQGINCDNNAAENLEMNVVEIGWGGYAEITIKLNLTNAMINSVVKDFSTKPIKTPADWGVFGGLEIVKNPKKKAKALLNKIKDFKQKPNVTLRFFCRGGCENLKKVSIKKITELLDNNRANFKIFGMGISISIHALVSKGRSKVHKDGCPNGKKRYIQEFLLDWVLIYNITPGVGGSAHLRKETIQVKSPCCPEEGNGTEPLWF